MAAVALSLLLNFYIVKHVFVVYLCRLCFLIAFMFWFVLRLFYRLLTESFHRFPPIMHSLYLSWCISVWSQGGSATIPPSEDPSNCQRPPSRIARGQRDLNPRPHVWLCGLDEITALSTLKENPIPSLYCSVNTVRTLRKRNKAII